MFSSHTAVWRVLLSLETSALGFLGFPDFHVTYIHSNNSPPPHPTSFL